MKSVLASAFHLHVCCKRAAFLNAGEEVVLAGMPQGPGGTTSCKISSSSWLVPSSESFQSSFTGAEEGGGAGRDSRHLTTLLIISSCPRLAFPPGTVPQEVFMLNSSSAILQDPEQHKWGVCWNIYIPRNGSSITLHSHPHSISPSQGFRGSLHLFYSWTAFQS